MTNVNVSTELSTVQVTDSSGSTIVEVPLTTVVTASTIGPQGAAGAGFDVDASGKVDKSVLYFNAASGKFMADEIITTATLVIGGNF